MATLGEIQDRINNDYLNRTDLTAETKRAIAGAVRFYERQRFWFNESSTALATVAAQSHIATQSTFFTTDRLRFFYQTSASYSLVKVDHEELLDMRGNQTSGKPTHYTEWGERYELFPIPDSAYTVVVYGIQQLPILDQTSSTASTNAWFSAAEDLVVFHATKVMWANVLRNTEEALKYAELERREYDQLVMASEQRLTKKLKSTKF